MFSCELKNTTKEFRIGQDESASCMLPFPERKLGKVCKGTGGFGRCSDKPGDEIRNPRGKDSYRTGGELSAERYIRGVEIYTAPDHN